MSLVRFILALLVGAAAIWLLFNWPRLPIFHGAQLPGIFPTASSSFQMSTSSQSEAGAIIYDILTP